MLAQWSYFSIFCLFRRYLGISSSFGARRPAKSVSPLSFTSDMTSLPLFLLDALHVDALDLHFFNFYVISASCEVRVGRACECVLRRYVLLVANFMRIANSLVWRAEAPCVARKSPNIENVAQKSNVGNCDALFRWLSSSGHRYSSGLVAQRARSRNNARRRTGAVHLATS